MIFMSFSVGVMTINNKKVPKATYTIVIDAGHGGRDEGCVGINGTVESEINLKIARVLKRYIESLGIDVVMTRSDGNGLYRADADNFKLSDMSKRLEIIDKNKSDMVISIHQNSYLDRSVSGAQAFFQEGEEVSEMFANSIQSQLLSQLPNARQVASKGDYYILKESNRPAVLVECGYLSNEIEEAQLNTEEYQCRVAYAIMCGVVEFFGLCG